MLNHKRIVYELGALLYIKVIDFVYKMFQNIYNSYTCIQFIYVYKSCMICIQISIIFVYKKHRYLYTKKCSKIVYNSYTFLYTIYI